MKQTISHDMLLLIAAFEEFARDIGDKKLSAYKCPANVWTIGFGNTFYQNGKKVKQGDIISYDEAIDLFFFVLGKSIEKVREDLGGVIIPQNHFDTLVSLSYNLGNKAYLNILDSYRDKVLGGKNTDLPFVLSHIMLYIKGDGKVLKGLVIRRFIEAYHMADLYSDITEMQKFSDPRFKPYEEAREKAQESFLGTTWLGKRGQKSDNIKRFKLRYANILTNDVYRSFEERTTK
jgi:lysozyme